MRKNQRLKKIGIASLIVAATFIVMGQAPTKKVIEANEFVLRDETGKTRALLEVTEGSVALMLYGPQGSNQLGSMSSIVARPNGGFIGLADRNGKNRMVLDLQPGDAPTLYLTDASSSPNIQLKDDDVAMLDLGREYFRRVSCASRQKQEGALGRAVGTSNGKPNGQSDSIGHGF